MTSPIPSPEDFVISELPAPDVECGTTAALNVERCMGFRGWKSGRPDSVKEVALLYSASRAAETSAFRAKYSVGDSPQGLRGGIRSLHGLSIELFRTDSLEAFLQAHVPWAFAIPLSAYFLAGSFADMEHFSAAHRNPDQSGHMVGINTCPEGVWQMEPMHSMGSRDNFAPWGSLELASLTRAYDEWGRDYMLGGRRMSLASTAPIPRLPAVPMYPLTDTARVFDGRIPARTKVAIDVAGIAGVPAETTRVEAILRVPSTPSGWLYIGPNPSRPLGPDPKVGGEPSVMDLRAFDMTIDFRLEGTKAIVFATSELPRFVIDVRKVDVAP